MTFIQNLPKSYIEHPETAFIGADRVAEIIKDRIISEPQLDNDAPGWYKDLYVGVYEK